MSTDAEAAGRSLSRKLPKSIRVNLKKIFVFVRDWWVPLSGLAVASWYIWKFFFDISVPVNIVVNIDSRIDATSAIKSDWPRRVGENTPVKFGVTAKNVSNRKTLSLFNPTWVAFGTTFYFPKKDFIQNTDPIDVLAEQEFGYPSQEAARGSVRTVERVDDATKRRMQDFAYSRELIAVGTLFGNSSIKPLEQIKSEQIVPVPRGRFDMIEIRVYIPTADASKTIKPFSTMRTRDEVSAYLSVRDPETGRQKNPNMIFAYTPDACRQNRNIPANLPISVEQCALDLLGNQAIDAQTQTSASQLWLGQGDAFRSKN